MDPRKWRRRRWPADERTRLMEERCDEYESAWRALRAPRIEDYLSGLDGETQASLWLELVRLDRELRGDRGETTTLADYRESCPDPVLLLDPSTARIDPDGDGIEGTLDLDGTRGVAAEFGPAAHQLDFLRIAGWRGPASDVSLDTTPTIDGAAGPADPLGTVGPPPEGETGDLDGLAHAQPGASFGDYVLVKELGSGGMGVVYEARQKGLDRVVALKLIKAGILAGEAEIRWFRREARAVAGLDHPNIVPVLESGEHLGVLYYSMKRIDGQDLHKSLGRFRDRPEAIARLVARVADAIAHAHCRGILHRDLKPSNILVDERGEPHVIDFGLARRLGMAGESSAAPQGGTPRYVSPEQARGDRGPLTVAVDVYGLGAVLYTMLTGHPPFTGDSREKVLHAVAHAEPPRPRVRYPRVDPDLETICLKCLRKEPEERYASAGELADDLNRWLDGRPILARPTPMRERLWKCARRHPAVSSLVAALAIAMIAGIGGIVWQWRQALAAREGMRGALILARASEDRAIAGEDDARHLAYASTLNLAERDWRDANVGQVLRHLEATRPPPGKSDLRGFEWYYLDRLARSQGRTLAGHGDVVRGLAYSPDGRRVASASHDRTIKIWDASTCQLIRTLPAAKPVHAVRFHPDGTRLASAGSDGELILWDVGTGQPIRSLPGHDPTRMIDHVAFSRDGKALASTSWDGTIKLWDVDSGTPLRSLADHPVGAIGEIAFSPDGKTLLSAGGGTPSIRIWEVASGRLFRQPPENKPVVIWVFCSTLFLGVSDSSAGSREGMMNVLTERVIASFKDAARKLTGARRRAFQARVTLDYLGGNAWKAERVFGWSHPTVTLGLNELRTGIICLGNFSARGNRKTEAKSPELEADIRALAEPESQTDPKFQSPFRYARMTAKAVRRALIDQRGWTDEELPHVNTIGEILNRLGYKLRRVQKTKPLKKIQGTDAIFDNVRRENQAADDDPDVIRISMDAKAKVAVGDYSRDGGSRGAEPTKALDHDPEPEQKLVPQGILDVTSCSLSIFIATSNGTSDFFADCLEQWWEANEVRYLNARRLVINLDNGPENSSHRTQFMNRLVIFADATGLEIKLVYYPPYHSKYNPIEHCWGVLESHWNGTLLNSIATVVEWAGTMTWKGTRPIVKLIETTYDKGVRITKDAFRAIESRLQRHDSLPKYDVLIRPQPV